MQETTMIKISLTLIIIGLPLLIVIAEDLPEIDQETACEETSNGKFSESSSDFSEHNRISENNTIQLNVLHTFL